MIYLAADTHGVIDFGKVVDFFDKEILSEDLSKDDYLIILGDLGFDDNPSLIMLLQDLPVSVLFIDGNHDNIDLLNDYYVDYWNNGKVHIIEDDIIHLMRGQVYKIENKTFFTFGGAYSIDKQFRKSKINWWENEMPTDEEYDEGIKNLDDHNWCVDYVLTHSAPYEVVENIVGEYYYGEEQLQYYLQEIYDSLKFKHWFFGHFHEDYEYDNLRCLYHDVIKL